MTVFRSCLIAILFLRLRKQSAPLIARFLYNNILVCSVDNIGIEILREI